MHRFLLLSYVLLTLPVSSKVASAQSAATTVTATPASTTAGGTVELTAIVQPANVSLSPGQAFAKPSGTISFLDGISLLNSSPIAVEANALVGTTFAQTFGTPNISIHDGELVGDLNGDGIADLLIYGGNGNPDFGVQSFVSNGHGGYSAGALQTLTNNVARSPYPSVDSFTPALIDLNADGKLDLLMGISVAYGNGDGTFAAPAEVSFLASGFVAAYAVDLNGDGTTDVLAVNSTSYPALQYAVTGFINEGKGTFTSAGRVLVGAGGMENIFSYTPTFLDLNGDGKLDVILQWNIELLANPQLSVLLNNGDGSFGSPSALSVPTPPNIIGPEFFYLPNSGDVNGDGKEDFLFAAADNAGNEYTVIMPGRGDGTFADPIFLTLPSIANAYISAPDFVLADVNLDGKLDLAFGNGQLAFGNGDGTFDLAPPLFPLTASGETTSYPTYPVTLLQIPGNSGASLVFLLTGGNPPPSANAVFTPQTSSSATLAATTLAVGTHTITARYSGDGTYSAGTSAGTTVTVNQATSATTLTSSANPSFAGQSVTLTAKVTSDGPTPTGNATFTSGSATLGTVALSAGAAAFTTSALTTPGTQAITASYGGDANTQSSSAGISQVVNAAFTLSADGSTTTLTVQSGKSVSAPINVTGASGFSGTVSFACSALPANATCSFSPATISVAGASAVPTLLSINTSANATTSELSSGPERGLGRIAYGLGFASLLALWPMRRKRLHLLFLLLMSLSAGMSLGLAGCGGSGSGGPKASPGTYSFTVTATSGIVSAQSAYSLVIQ